ncbi:hypothetical protein FQA39_LY02832 [Lamprigera yunnana]|nr:hypothetical protein FQA39_LY02832 [Lamprigera yunnana]
MDADFIESCAIKSEEILTETFSFSGQYRDYGNKELKTEPVDYEESFKCKEEDISVQHTGVHTAPKLQFSCNECDFMTMEKDSLIEHLKISKNVQYSCKECNFTTQLQCYIRKHFKIHKQLDDKYIIEECKFQTSQIFCLTPQWKTQKSGDKYICNECNYTTLIESSLKRHVKIHKMAEYKCKECDYKTVRKYRLMEHVKIHTGDEYKCKDCDYKTVWQSSLKEHVKIHTGDKYECKECDYKTVWQSSLKKHLKIHTGDEYKCKDCDYKTVWESSIKKHVKIHTGDEHKCNECDYKTVRKESLKEHVKIHTDDEYKCKECDYKTVRKNSLKNHVKIHTGDEYKCKNCDYKTVWQRSLNNHLKIHTDDEYKCKECDYKTVRKDSLKNHLKIHTGDKYECKECDYKTTWQSCLKKHIKIHIGDKYECNECDYKTLWQSSLKNHEKIHTDDKYKCIECDYKTVRKDSLKKHVKIHTGKCPDDCKLPTFLYESFKCKPVCSTLDDCPTSYDCSMISKHKDKCYYNGNYYSNNENAQDDVTWEKCFGCTCDISDDGSQFYCYSGSCRSPLISAGCVLKRKLGHCCTSDIICAPYKECTIINTTFTEDFGGLYNRLEHPTEKCTKCSCEEGSDKIVGVKCQKQYCTDLLKSHHEVKRMCAPLYESTNYSCCPSQWLCPSDVKFDTIAPSDGGQGQQCVFGKQLIGKNKKHFTQYDERKVVCECLLPPFITCAFV